MAKGQMKPSKEKKKPKQVKPAAAAAGGKGAAPKNQVYIATSFGFQIFACSSADADPSQPIQEQLIPAKNLFSFATNFSWDLTTGRGNVRTISTLLDQIGRAHV